MSCGVVCRPGSDPALLRLWCRLAAVVLIQPPAWELHMMWVQAYKKKKKEKKKKNTRGVPVLAQWLMNPTRNHEVVVRSPASLSGLRIPHCRELWCRSQMWLRSSRRGAMVNESD